MPVISATVSSSGTGFRAALTDVIGVLQSWDPDGLVVRHADSSLHEVVQRDVTAAKPIPEMPLRPVDVEQLFLTTALGRPAVETSYVGQWLLRASSGWTGRAQLAAARREPRDARRRGAQAR